MTFAVLADIASGEADWADIFLLVAVILSLVAAFLFFQPKNVAMAVLSLALGFVAAGLLMF